ncbi:type IV pilus twitching motility protein PilT [Humisphaera borealis]|uniref:Type IV pilus twitching motility protein PilT n=1 Tax=Humisphaera borealis TaxID=2807512 RepID=A0A7M2WX63_9BACT|nr:type IV pilus twitching motility protein PilT [Humisphaera borealis]QOV90117.1 type IV pilus twitching motility protein PilT [Humisphaera borealis]
MSILNDILRNAVQAKASDVHIMVGAPPLYRIHTIVQHSDFPMVTPEGAIRLAKEMMNEKRWTDFEKHRDADFSYEIPGVSRFRVNAHYQRNSVALSIRTINDKVRPIEQLFLPDICNKLTYMPRGLVLVTGPTGSGKSTTLAAMIDSINRREQGHIITLEDPIEYAFVSNKSAIEQREVGADVPDFSGGLRHALRQDPDVILVGEMRDLETTSAAITAAETGHLVFSTLHTVNAPQTIERIIDIYPSDEQNQIRSMLANTLQAVISQTLFKRSDQPGMIPGVEIMLCTPAVRNCIRENRIFEIPNIIATSRALGMQSLDDSIKQMYINGYISREDAVAQAAHPEKLERALAA